MNSRAAAICRQMIADAELLRIAVHQATAGPTVIDCGIDARGGLEAGRRLADVCMAGLGDVSLVPAPHDLSLGLAVVVRSDWPVLACMAAEYAGWKVQQGDYFAMASGPMRAAAGKESLLETLGIHERPTSAVGVLETRRLPPPDVLKTLAEACGVAPDHLTILVAPTASQAGTVQIVARSLETALHKLFELGFDLHRIESGYGIAPLPPVAADDLTAIGRTNDAILYGGEVTLWVRGADADLEAIGPKIPSSASPDFGAPFGEIFTRYNKDFYAIDPHLFSPAVVTLANLDTGRSFRFGRTMSDVIRKSFGTELHDI
ncbi:MAG TPA: methenyltetrahydromethanopterin cyclohydrolase [Pirellulales bacterium]|nr:methenyltetrahydromethanopterin cyclohydrolase [Pirellulales bacterium]